MVIFIVNINTIYKFIFLFLQCPSAGPVLTMSSYTPGMLPPMGIAGLPILLSRCCKTRSCVNNIMGLSDRLATVPMMAWYSVVDHAERNLHPLIKDGTCQGCDIPFRSPAGLRYLEKIHLWRSTEDITSNLKEPFLQLAINPPSPSGTRIFYFVKNKAQARVEGQIPIRRNVLNVLVIHPKHNAYRVWHQTFTYPPRNISVNMMTERLLTQALQLMEAGIQEHKGFFCKCS